MEISTAAGSSSLAVAEEDEQMQDTAAVASSIYTTHPSDADESELEESAQDQAKVLKSVDKGKGRDEKKHSVMSLPAEIRETYAFQWSAWSDQCS